MANEQIVKNGLIVEEGKIVIRDGVIYANIKENVTLSSEAYMNVGVVLDEYNYIMNAYSQNGSTYTPIYSLRTDVNGDFTQAFGIEGSSAPEQIYKISLHATSHTPTHKFMSITNNVDNLLAISNDGTVIIGGDEVFTSSLVIAGNKGVYNNSDNVSVDSGGLELFQASDSGSFFIAKSEGLNNYISADTSFMSSSESFFQIRKLNTPAYADRTEAGGVLLSAYNGFIEPLVASVPSEIFKFHARQNPVNNNTAGFRFELDKADSTNDNERGLVDDTVVFEFKSKVSTNDTTFNTILSGSEIYGDAGTYIGSKITLGGYTDRSTDLNIRRILNITSMYHSTSGTFIIGTQSSTSNSALLIFSNDIANDNTVEGVMGTTSSYITKGGSFWSVSESSAHIFLGYNSSVTTLLPAARHSIKLNVGNEKTVEFTMSASSTTSGYTVPLLQNDVHEFFKIKMNIYGTTDINHFDPTSNSTTPGGLNFNVLTNQATTTDSYNSSDATRAPVMFNIAKHVASTTSGDIGDRQERFDVNDNIFIIKNGLKDSDSTNFARNILTVKGGGKHIIYTNGIAGGGNYVSLELKDYYINHGITAIADHDTYATIGKFHEYSGGLKIIGINDGSTTTYGQEGIRLVGAVNAANVMTATTSSIPNLEGVINIVATKKNGAGTQVFGATEVIFSIQNNVFNEISGNGTKLLLTGDGTLYLDGDDDTYGSAGVSPRLYDTHDDIMLAETARFMLAGGNWKKNVLKENKKQLETLGIMTNGFINVQKMQALHLGTMGQLWNMIRNMGNMLGFDEKKLLEMAKQY